MIGTSAPRRGRLPQRTAARVAARRQRLPEASADRGNGRGDPEPRPRRSVAPPRARRRHSGGPAPLDWRRAPRGPRLGFRDDPAGHVRRRAPGQHGRLSTAPAPASTWPRSTGPRPSWSTVRLRRLRARLRPRGLHGHGDRHAGRAPGRPRRHGRLRHRHDPGRARRVRGPDPQHPPGPAAGLPGLARGARRAGGRGDRDRVHRAPGHARDGRGPDPGPAGRAGLAGDTEETLHERIKVVERTLYPATVAWALGELEAGRRIGPPPTGAVRVAETDGRERRGMDEEMSE